MSISLVHPAVNGAPSFRKDTALLDREADHRIANNLGLIVGLLRLRSRAVAQRPGKIERAEVSVLLEDIAARVETVARLHRMLSESYRHALIDLGVYLQELCTSLGATLSPKAQVEVSHHIEQGCSLPPDQVLTLGMLVSELVTNSVKYAHPTGLPVKIDIGCRQTAAGQLLIEFSDDGIGLPEGFNPAVDGGLGLRMVRSLAAQLQGTIHFDSDPLGTRIRLEIPPAGSASAASA